MINLQVRLQILLQLDLGNLYQILKDAATTINPETGLPLVSVFNSSLTREYTINEVVGDRMNNEAGIFQYVQTVETFDEFGDVIDLF